MSHRNAPLSELGRLRLARCVVDDGWPLRRAAERFQVSATTAARWAGRYRLLGTDFCVFVFGKTGESLAQWHSVPSADELAAAIKKSD